MSRPPLPPATRIEPPPPPRYHVEPEPHTIPGWVGAIVYLVLVVVMTWLILTRMMPGTSG